MQLSIQRNKQIIMIKSHGRLDASWSKYFEEQNLEYIREGHHHILWDFAELEYISSAGIRSLMIIYKSLLQLEGKVQIIKASEIVRSTLEMTGFSAWFDPNLPDDWSDCQTNQTLSDSKYLQVYPLKAESELHCECIQHWSPWVYPKNLENVVYGKNKFGLGIGSSKEEISAHSPLFGEFVAIDSCVSFQRAEKNAKADYLISESNFIPELKVIQAINCSGEMSHLIRFSADQEKRFFTITELCEQLQQILQKDCFAFVLAGETEGLSGAQLIKSPSLNQEGKDLGYPEIKEYLSFSGEKVYQGQSVLLFGIVKKSNPSTPMEMLTPLCEGHNLSAHIHAIVFPYQPLQNNQIDLSASIRKFFTGPAPLSVMHLVNDERILTGIGQSTFVRGACWCAGIQNQEVIS